MDVMDNVVVGKYNNDNVIIDGFGWAKRVGPSVYKQSSLINYHRQQLVIKRKMMSDLFSDMEVEDLDRSGKLFDFCWEKACEVPGTVIAWFRELCDIVN